MKLPRDVSGPMLIKRLRRLEYFVVRQRGSHVTIRTVLNGLNTQQVPNHKAIRTSTLENILKDVADHHGFELGDLVTFLDL